MNPKFKLLVQYWVGNTRKRGQKITGLRCITVFKHGPLKVRHYSTVYELIINFKNSRSRTQLKMYGDE
jgi:hypothetical protein